MTFRYAALADSSGVGVGATRGGGYPDRLVARWKKRGVAVQTMNLSKSGALAGDLIASAQHIAKKEADLVTVGVGTNDVWRLTSEAEFQQNIEAIASALSSYRERAYFLNLPDASLAPAALHVERWLGIAPRQILERITAFNVIIARVTQKYTLSTVDLFALSQATLPGHPEYFSGDGFHPSDAGYEVWTDLLWDKVGDLPRSQP
jgi:lysophospholipase L1-like esterase